MAATPTVASVVPWFIADYNVDAWRPSQPATTVTPSSSIPSPSPSAWVSPSLPLSPFIYNEYVPSQRLLMADPFGQLHSVSMVHAHDAPLTITKCSIPLSPSLTSLASDSAAQPKVEDMLVISSSSSLSSSLSPTSNNDQTCIVRIMHQYSHDDDDKDNTDGDDASMDSPDWIEVWPVVPLTDTTGTNNDSSTASDGDTNGMMLLMETVSSPARVVHLPGGRLIWLPPSSRDNDSDHDDAADGDQEQADTATFAQSLVIIELGYFATSTRVSGRSRLPIIHGRDVVWSIRTLADNSDAILVLTGTTLTKPRSLWICYVATNGEITHTHRVCRGMIQHVLPLRSGQCVIHMDGALQLWSLTNHGRCLPSVRDIVMIHSCVSPLSIRVQWFELTTPGRIVAVTTERVIIYNSYTNMITYSQPLTGVRTICICNSVRHHDCVIVEMELNGAAAVELWQLPPANTDITSSGFDDRTVSATILPGKCQHMGITRELLWYSDDQMMGNIDQILSLPNGMVCMIRVSYDDHRCRSNLCVINLLHQSPLTLTTALPAPTPTSTAAASPTTTTTVTTYSRSACYVGRLIGGDTGPMMLLSLPSLPSAIMAFSRSLYNVHALLLPSPLLTIIAQYACD